jgi:hypothetical protein
MDRTACTEPQCLYNRDIPLLPLWAVRPVQNLSVCTRVNFILPYLTLSYFTLPYLTLTHFTLPYATLPYVTLPYLTSPYLTLRYFTLPYLTLPHLTVPYVTLSYLTLLTKSEFCWFILYIGGSLFIRIIDICLPDYTVSTHKIKQEV